MLSWKVPVLLSDPNADNLILTTGVPMDDQFSSPKQIRWSAALGKLLVANSGPASYAVRNADLSYSDKCKSGDTVTGVCSDAINLYFLATYGLYKRTLSYTLISGGSIAIASPRMIDASGDPLHVYVTSNNATDGHGVRMVTKSTMAVTGGGTPVQILATGTGDNQFTNPLGLLYIATNADSGFLYVCEATRICKIAVVTTAGSESFTWTTSYAIAANDLAWDGTNFYVQSSTQTIKYDNVFTDATKVATACVGYSITYIPDQGDGYSSTIAIVDNTNSHLERRKCSDLSAINSVGSAGDGSSSLFDPTFTTSAPTQIEYRFDDGFVYLTPLGTSHALLWNGFAGYSFRSAGPHKCTVAVRGGLGLVTGIECSLDAITSMKNLAKLINCISFALYTNNFTSIIESIPVGKATVIQFSICPYLVGSADRFSTTPLTTYYTRDSPLVSGSIANFPPTLQVGHFFGCLLITPAPIAHLIAIRDLRIHSMGWNQAGVDTVISSMWAARAAYTYATPSLQIGGTNAAPSGSYVAPEEGVNWHEDSPGHWVPLTGKAMIYDLINDVNGEGFNQWAITYTA